MSDAPIHLRVEHTPAINELTILGNGFFIVRDPNSTASYATQSGNFVLDADGYLVTVCGARVQGAIDGTGTHIGDIQIEIARVSYETATENGLLYYAVDECGRIIVHLTDGSSCLCGQLLLQNFEDPRALVSEGGRLYSNLEEAGPLPTMAAPGSNGLGSIHTGVLDFTNAFRPRWAA